MRDLPAYQFPARPAAGLLFGLSPARLGAVVTAGVVLVTTLTRPTPPRALVGLLLIGVLLAAAAIRVGGRAVIDWLPVWVAFGWQQATRNNEFYATSDLDLGLPDGTLDLPGELFGIEIHQFDGTSRATVANPTPTAYGVVRDTFRHRLVAIAEIAGEDFLFLDSSDQQARINAWGRVLDHIAQSLPDLSRLQVVHTVSPALHALAAYPRGPSTTATVSSTPSYRQVLAMADACSQQHRVLLAIGVDVRAARRAIRQAGGGRDGAARVLMDRAAAVEETLRSAGLAVQGWLPAGAIGAVMQTAFDAAAHRRVPEATDANECDWVTPAAAGPTGMADGWAAVRHDSGWSTTLHVLRPPARPVTGDFLQHLLIGVPAQRRLSLLYVPTPLSSAERRAQTQQVSAESEQRLRVRWGFGISARQRRAWQDAAQREEDLVEGRSVYRVTWLLTVTAATPADLDIAVGQVEAAARRCSLELRRLSGTQRQAFAFTLPLCRGAR